MRFAHISDLHIGKRVNDFLLRGNFLSGWPSVPFRRTTQCAPGMGIIFFRAGGRKQVQLSGGEGETEFRTKFFAYFLLRK